MNFTAKEDYGLRAVLDLAANAGAGPVQTREIASRQHIPEQFLEQLLAALRRAEVVRSTRGAGGGYALAATPDKITVGQVLRALSGPLVPTELVTGEGETRVLAELPETIVVRHFWETVRAALRGVCDETTVQDHLERRSHHAGDIGYMMHI